jgi:hypothetical protein
MKAGLQSELDCRHWQKKIDVHVGRGARVAQSHKYHLENLINFYFRYRYDTRAASCHIATMTNTIIYQEVQNLNMIFLLQ